MSEIPFLFCPDLILQPGKAKAATGPCCKKIRPFTG
jgi:hypothetical protein